VITQANTSTNGYLSSTDWNTFNNKFATPAGTTLQYVDGTGALQTFPVLASADKLVINVRNASGVSMPKGSVVYINGATGNKPTVALSQGNSDATSAQTLGLLQATLANNAEGNVVIVGSVIDLNTSAFTEGQQLYLSPTTAGTYTATKQYAPNHLVYVGVVTRSHVSLGTIEVKVQNGYEMDELHNVSAQSPSNNDGLFYNTTTSLWEKKSIATVLGYTPYNGTDTSIKALFSASTPLSYSNGVYGISQATTSSNGYLSSTDWNTFNGKESVLSFTTPLVRTTNTISINQANASTSGFLSSTDWNTFNNKSSTSGTVTSVAMTVPTGLSIAGSPITTSGTLALSLTAGYVIPSTTSTGQWDTAYTNRITSLTVTGSSGSATLVSNVLNIPTYTLVGLGGQVALNGTGFVKATGTTISYDNTSYLPLTGNTMSGSIGFSDSALLKRGMYGTMGGNDYWFIGAGATATNSGYIEIATGDDATEPIYVRQYNGDPYTTGTISRTATILDASGNSIFPNTLTATTLVKSGGTSSQYLMADGSVSTITNNITGTGTTNYISKFTSSSAIGNSLIYDNGTNVGIGTISPSTLLHVNGTARISSTLRLEGNMTVGSDTTQWSLSGIANGGAIWQKSNSVNGGYDDRYLRLGNVDNSGTPNYVMTIFNSNVGIGTTSPTVALDVTGAGKFSGVATAKSFSVVATNGYSGQIIQQGDIFGTSATNLLIQSSTSNGIGFLTNGGTTFNMFINSTGNVGIGTTSPSARLDVKQSSDNYAYGISLSNIAGNNWQWVHGGDNNLYIGYNTTTKFFVSNAGNVGIGTTSPSYKLSVVGPVLGNAISWTDNANNTGYLGIRGGAASFGADNNLVFETGATERMRIQTNGQVKIGTTGNYYADSLVVYAGIGNGEGGITIAAAGNTSRNFLAFADGTGGEDRYRGLLGYNHTDDSMLFYTNANERIRINTNGNTSINYAGDAGYRLYVSGAIYATSNITANSDLTLKKNLTIIDNPIDKLIQLNGYAYQWKSDDSHQYGVIAQEVEKILPYAVSTGNDGIKGVSYNQIIPVLIEAIKVQNKRIVELESKIA
jgi:hypothetical protein